MPPSLSTAVEMYLIININRPKPLSKTPLYLLIHHHKGSDNFVAEEYNEWSKSAILITVNPHSLWEKNVYQLPQQVH